MEQDTVQTTKEGILHKRGKGESLFGKTTWKQRFFRLEGNCLKYYKSKRGARNAHSHLGQLQLDNNSICDCYDDVDPQTLQTFALVTPQRTLYLCAGNEKQKWEWIDEIRRHIKAASEPPHSKNKGNNNNSNYKSSSNYDEEKRTLPKQQDQSRQFLRRSTGQFKQNFVW